MQPMRLGVIGLGLIWLRAHKPILLNRPEAITPVALCDLAAERRATATADFPDAKIFADYYELLQLPALDTVLVLTPIAFNAPIALAALEAGKDVIMEKPIARSVAEGQRLVETAHRLGRRLFVLEQLGYRQAETLLAEQLATGVIGDLVLWERVQHLEADTAHSKLFGTPTKVAATGRKLRAGYGDFDQVTMFFQYANGVTGLFSHSAYLPPAKNYFYLHGKTGAISVEPQRLVIEKAGQPTQVIDLPAEHAYTSMWQALIAAYQRGEEPYYTADRALQDVAILEAVAQAIQTGQSMSIVQVV